MVGVQRKGRRFNERGKEWVERGDWELSGGRKNNQLESILFPNGVVDNA